jgi:hypothetical protein
MTDRSKRAGDIFSKKVGRPLFPLFLLLVIVFALFVALGVRAGRHITTADIAGYICLDCMGFK